LVLRLFRLSGASRQLSSLSRVCRSVCAERGERMACESQFLVCDNCFSHCVTMSTVFVSGCFRSCFLGTGIAENCSALSHACRCIVTSDNSFMEIAAGRLENALAFVWVAERCKYAYHLRFVPATTGMTKYGGFQRFIGPFVSFVKAC
jgi:hypothetical protein